MTQYRPVLNWKKGGVLNKQRFSGGIKWTSQPLDVWLSNLSILCIPGENDTRNMSCALNVISTCVFCTDINTWLENHFKHVKLVQTFFNLYTHTFCRNKLLYVHCFVKCTVHRLLMLNTSIIYFCIWFRCAVWHTSINVR
jgi:hypothetical protein